MDKLEDIPDVREILRIVQLGICRVDCAEGCAEGKPQIDQCLDEYPGAELALGNLDNAGLVD